VQVEAAYGGPQTDEGEITAEFVEEMLAWQKAEKKLHTKFALQVSLHETTCCNTL